MWVAYRHLIIKGLSEYFVEGESGLAVDADGVGVGFVVIYEEHEGTLLERGLFGGWYVEMSHREMFVCRFWVMMRTRSSASARVLMTWTSWPRARRVSWR